ncbi:MAG: hypothetical protein KDB00_22075 [Planctomycetales bacterium]|nr:hypothetical protein [Planctomycetales bacterium]
MAKKKRIPHKFLPWIDARKKFRLSHMHIQMARELGMNPKRFGDYANTKNQPWKAPLPEFIAKLYQKRFGKDQPDVVLTIEEISANHMAKRADRKAKKLETAQRFDAHDQAESVEADVFAPSGDDSINDS